MKKILLVFSIFAALVSHAQLINNCGFESWATDTAHFAGFSQLGFVIVAGDTFPYSDPVGWTSTNQVSGARSLGGLFHVTRDTTPYAGHYAIRMQTDTVKSIDTIPFLGSHIKLVVPGLVLNGNFTLNTLVTNLAFGGTISPGVVPGAGTPCTQQLATFKGYYKYAPVFDSITNAMDTCIMWATLRKGKKIIANAQFTSQTSTNGQYIQFSAPFVYLSCDVPDTLVILLASSVPNFTGIFGGNTKLVRGSVLVVDTLQYDTLPPNYVFAPFAKNDRDTVYKNSTNNIFNVVANDTDCTNGQTLTVSINRGPFHGTASSSAGLITYAPTTGYTGPDTIWYKDTNTGGDTADAVVFIQVIGDVGVSEANQVAVQMYPVPASNQLSVDFENPGKTNVRVYDMVGNLVVSTILTGNHNNIDLGNLANGFYGLQLSDENNSIIARAKFVVSK